MLVKEDGMGRPVVHFDIGCQDREKAASFYSALFDWKTEPYGEYSEKVDTGSGVGIMGSITALGHEPSRYVMVYVEVDDIPGHLEKVVVMGGKVVVPETEVPGGGRFAWFSDPDGNTMGLWNSGS
jgi:hypothetical protein